MLQQISAEPLHEQAYRALREALMSGRLKPGQALTIRGLSLALGVSATPAREALQRLIAERALVLSANRAILVPLMSRRRFEEITKLRLPLEGLAAAEAGPHLTQAVVKQLMAHDKAMARALRAGDFASYLQHNERFHFALYGACRMPFLLGTIEMAWLQIGPWLNILADEGKFQHSANAYHGEIVAFAQSRDAAGLERAVRKDIGEAAKYLVKLLPAKDDP